ncbi:MAG: ChaN family lipoprotein, partial [Candidatus Aminicenantales bacterium]
MNQTRARAIFLFAAFLIFSSLPALGEDDESVLRLRIGDQALKDKLIEVEPGKIVSAKSGSAISFERMVAEMARVRFVYLGETHDSLAMHRIQARIIRSLSEKDGPWAVGLEMFPVTRQEVLTKWSLGILEEEEFVREARWYETWNFNFGFYRDVFSVIKEKGIPLYALNVPRPWISKIRMKGWEALSEEERRFVPQPDLSHEEHRKLIRTIFENTEMPHGMKGEGLDMVFKGLYRAQSAWDETMAYHAVNAARREKARMIVLAGSGHL